MMQFQESVRHLRLSPLLSHLFILALFLLLAQKGSHARWGKSASSSLASGALGGLWLHIFARNSSQLDPTSIYRSKDSCRSVWLLLTCTTWPAA